MSTASQASHPKVALLWDLDNVCVPLVDLDLLAQALCGLVDPEAPRIASANWRLFRLAWDTLRARGIRVLCGAWPPRCSTRTGRGSSGTGNSEGSPVSPVLANLFGHY